MTNRKKNPNAQIISKRIMLARIEKAEANPPTPKANNQNHFCVISKIQIIAIINHIKISILSFVCNFIQAFRKNFITVVS